MIFTRRALSTELASHGFCLVSADDLHLGDPEKVAFRDFLASWHDLPPDPYLPPDQCFRRRRHAHFALSRSSGRPVRLPDGPYYQSRMHNPLFGGRERRFAPLGREMGTNLFLTELLRFNAHSLPLDWSELHIHIHLVRILGSQELHGEPTPEGFHSDGFEYVSMHLVHRQNVNGGETEVVTEDGVHLLKDTLRSSLDSLYLNDRSLRHFTSAIAPSTMGPAHRDTLLISYDQV